MGYTEAGNPHAEHDAGDTAASTGLGLGGVDEPHWTRSGSRIVYDGRMRVVEHTATLPDGTPAAYEVDESIPFAVAVLVQDADGALLLTRQYRFPLDRWIYDLPGGAGELGEEPAVAAARECREETGLIPSDLTFLHTFHPNPGRSSWPAHLFFATVVEPGVAADDDPSESVNAVHVTVAELDAMIDEGGIVDPSLLIARFLAERAGLLRLPRS